MKITRLILCGLLLANFLAWLGIWGDKDSLEVVFFDVGQGDAIFIETPHHHQILIDGGPSSVVSEKLGKEMPFWDRTLDLIVLTHPDFDHLAGLIEVLKRYEVKNILWTGVACGTAECQEWKRLIEAEGANIRLAQAGQQIKGGGILLDVLYPFENIEGKEVKNTNDTSIVLRLVYGENSFLLTGDIYQSVEEGLIGEGIDSDILKVAHHGSKYSSSQEFIEAVSPDLAVISVGKDNNYGHPSQEVLKNLADCEIFRTDLEGDIKIISDGSRYRAE